MNRPQTREDVMGLLVQKLAACRAPRQRREEAGKSIAEYIARLERSMTFSTEVLLKDFHAARR